MTRKRLIASLLAILSALAFDRPAAARSVPAQGVSAEDERIYAKLEGELRAKLDEMLSKFKPLDEKERVRLQPPPSASSTPTLSSSYDRFKDLTSVSVTMPLYHEITPPKGRPVGNLAGYIADFDLIASYVHEGQQRATPASVNLTIKTFAGGVMFGGAAELILLVDGRRVRLGRMEQVISFHGRSAEEYVSVAIPYDTFTAIANAETVEAQAGRFEFPFSEEHLRGFRLLAGLPDRPRRADARDAAAADPSADLNGTTWQGKDFAIRFLRGGVAVVRFGTRDREGAWRRRGDVVEIELPYVDNGAVRALGVGVVRQDKMAVRLKVQGWLGGSTFATVTQRVE